jgi:hypothetical protein
MRRLLSPLSRFRASEQGSLSVEAILIFPILLWAYGAMFIYWDAFKAQNVNLKATYTVADFISREVDPITPTDIAGLSDVFAYLIRSNEGNDLRVTVVGYIVDPADPTGDPIMDFRWSHAVGAYTEHTDLTEIADDLPLLTVGDELIYVESRMWWDPPLNFDVNFIGLTRRQMSNTVFMAPRFTPQVTWDGNEDGEADDLSS